ncbi:unnamed protein product, partial [Closterium sp. NIES-54]
KYEMRADTEETTTPAPALNSATAGTSSGRHGSPPLPQVGEGTGSAATVVETVAPASPSATFQPASPTTGPDSPETPPAPPTPVKTPSPLGSSVAPSTPTVPAAPVPPFAPLNVAAPNVHSPARASPGARVRGLRGPGASPATTTT